MDAFELEDLSLDYKCSAAERWKFRNSAGARPARAASALAYLRDDGSEPDYRDRGTPRRGSVLCAPRSLSAIWRLAVQVGREGSGAGVDVPRIWRVCRRSSRSAGVSVVAQTNASTARAVAS